MFPINIHRLPWHSARSRLLALFILFTAASLACSLPGIFQRDTPPETEPLSVNPTPLPEILPPALVESNPPPGAEVPLDSSFKLIFNQPMDRASVEAALNLSGVSGKFDWADDSVMTFIPDASLLPDTDLQLKISVIAQSSRGMPLNKPIELRYRTAGPLRLAQFLPSDGQVDVDSETAVVASFNQPVVPLGAEPSSLPPALTLDPAANGRGEWINTSTYIFYPEPGLAGGLTYTASLNPDLASAAGTTLEQVANWSFSVAQPKVTGFEVQDALGVLLDTPIQLFFNQRMDPESVANGFSLLGPEQTPVEGEFEWDESFKNLAFTPTELLARGATYTLSLASTAASAAGTPLDEPFQTSWVTVANLTLINSYPSNNGVIETWEAMQLTFSSPLPETGFEPYFRFEPAVENVSIFFYEGETTLGLFADFKPNTSYVLYIDAGLQDRWGGALEGATSLAFRTARLQPSLDSFIYPSVTFLTPLDTGITVQLTNLSSLPVALERVSSSDLIALTGPNGYDLRQNFRSEDRQTWQESFTIPADQATPVQLPLNPAGIGLEPGIYMLRVELDSQITYTNNFLLLVSNVHLTYKVSAEDVLVWAVDTRTDRPVANAPIVVYDEAGNELVRGLTDEDGVFHAEQSGTISPHGYSTVIMGQPGEELFAAAVAGWYQGIEPYYFNIASDFRGPGLETYLYTDRPIYRPGQIMYFKAIARQESNGRYSIPESLSTLPVKIFDSEGVELASYNLALSAFGSVHGEYNLIPEAKPGYYRLESGENAVYFQVVDYRKPEINLQVTFNKDQTLAGAELSAQVEARYFFDAPAGNITLDWVLYESDAFIHIPGYQTGPQDDRWMHGIYFDPISSLGVPVAQGSAQTQPDGTITLDVENPAVSERLGRNTRRYILEVTAQDESGLPVSNRASVLVHPADFYIGIRPELWVGQAGQEAGYEVFLADWESKPAGSQKLSAAFSKVEYIRQEPETPYDFAAFTAEYTPIASADFTTGPDGKARLAFTAPEPGTYQLEVQAEGALTQVLLWFGGAGQAVWPDLPNQRILLATDQDLYQPGDTAQVFVPNPFPNTAEALVTIERGLIMHYEIHRLAPGGSSIAIPLTGEEAPNIYVSVSLLGRDEQDLLDFRQGYTEIEVTPVEQTLNVNLTSQPERTGPGGEVTFSLRVTDSEGQPVQGEFSLAVIDLAALALADPNTVDILPAYYGPQPLGVSTNLALTAYGNRSFNFEGGIGGGGGADLSPTLVREEFPDTAYWNAEVLTDADGRAQVVVRLPDSLTTWQVDVRGLTVDTRVGQVRTDVITTKEVLIRPVTPRFLVSGDHTELAAVVQNNSPSDLTAQVSLQAAGFVLDEDQPAQVQVSVPAGGRARVTWWGTAQDAISADLIFSVQAGEYQDIARPAFGALPIVRYTARQAFATSGYLDGAVQQLELVSLPPAALLSDLPGEAGQLRVELAPSLAAAMLAALDALEYYPYDSNEHTLARFLPNLLLHRALNTFNIAAPDVQARLERTLQPGLQKLIARQNFDGGWGWWNERESDPYISAYVLFGFTQAQRAGAEVPAMVIQKAIDYLVAAQASSGKETQAYLLDRQVFQLFSLAEAGSIDPAAAQALYAEREQLSPWARALLALVLEASAPGNEQAADLLATLQAEASRSASGAFWMDSSPRWQNLNNTVSTTAMVVYALARRDPASPLLPDAVRFIMASRGAQGAWQSTFETTWALLATTAFMQGTGELSGDFSFQATLNGAPLASGQAEGETRLTPVRASVSLTQLFTENPNALRFERSAGTGRLYYTALLDVAFPAELVAPLNRGLVVERTYHRPANCNRDACPAFASGAVGERLKVRLTLVIPQDAYHVLVEDFIPAGSEILNPNLRTSQLGSPEFFLEPEPLFDPANPFNRGWGWWLFTEPAIYDDHIAWTASYLPAGTYELTYNLTLLQPGEYRLLPARAAQLYFPDVQGNSAGAVFRIVP
jgi:alpha-2-macroglobulin